MLLSFQRRLASSFGVCALLTTMALGAQQATNTGPYNLTFLEGGVGLSRVLAAEDPTLAANASWSLSGWLGPTLAQSGDVVIAEVGETSADSCRCLALHDGKLQLRAGGFEITAPRAAQVGQWQSFAATYDGQSLRLYVDGQPAGIQSVTNQLPAVTPVLALAPPAASPEQHFGGSLAQFQLEATALSAAGAQRLFDTRPDFSLVVFQNVGAGWPWQEHAWRGLQVPQDPWTLPKAHTPPSPPVAASDIPTSPLFLANAREVLLRYRNHPSIAVWFGRNEGVPQPIINEGLADLIANLDGTRHYTGTPSLSTLESLEATLPPADRWPISDTLAYHDWHFGGNGDVASFMSALERQLGAATSLADFERKAQMLNYVSYRAVFEGFQAHLWTRNSGRLLWMTHPAWPSNHWQIYSSDYDTQASYYGVKSACEAVHVQMNLPDYRVAVVNTIRQERRNLTLTSRVIALDGRLLARHTTKVSATANSTTTLPSLNLASTLATEDLVLVVLTLDEPGGTRVSENIYWQGRDDHSQQKLNSLAPQSLSVTAQSTRGDGETVVSVTLENRGSVPALATKLTVVDGSGQRVLPVLYSDNYLTLLPHEPRKVDIRCPDGGRCSQIQLRGWNVVPAAVSIEGSTVRHSKSEYDVGKQ